MLREPLTAEDHETIWSMYENGVIWDAIGEAVGRSSPTVRRIINTSDGKRPAEPTVWCDGPSGIDLNATTSSDLWSMLGWKSAGRRIRFPTL